MPVSHLGETVVKMFEASHMGLPVAFLSSLAGPIRLNHDERSALFSGQEGLANWAWRMGKKSRPLIAVWWEKHWETDFDAFRREIGFDEEPPIKVGYTGRTKTNSKTRGKWPSKVYEHVGQTSS